MKSVLKVCGVLLLPAFMLTGCGDMKLGDRVQLRLDPNAQTANLEVEMSSGMEMSISGDYPIDNGKGRLYFVPATRTTNAKIGVEVNLAVLAGGAIGNVGSVTTLPNGAALPVAMTPPLLSVPVLHNSNFSIDAQFAITPELQIGAAAGIAQFSSKYVPVGSLAVCQNFRNEQNVAFAAICLYGPSTDGRSGGIFVGSNFGQVLDLNNLIPSGNRSMMLASSSAPFAISNSSHALSFDAMNVSSAKFDSSIIDPKKDLSGNKGIKAWNNVTKILRVKR